MEFAYLQRNDDPKHGSSLVIDKTTNETAILRARTLIAILSEKQLLTSIPIVDDWIVYFPTFSKTFMEKISIGTQPPNVVAIIPVLPYKQIWEQPGIFAIRSSLEVQTLFNGTFLSFSKKWMQDNPDKVEQIYHNLDHLAKA
mgnify:CR=1 FL=1